MPAIVAEIKEAEREEIQLVENIQREDLSAKDLTGSIHKLWKKHGSIAKVAQICNKSKSWVSKRLAIALDVGALTVQLLDANVKDVELLYAFSMLEKADDQRARALLPDILEKQKGRKDVQSELQIALGKKADSKPEEKEEDVNLDLFDTPAVTTGDDENNIFIALKFKTALDALRAVAGQARRRSDGKCWILSNKAMTELKEALGQIGRSIMTTQLSKPITRRTEDTIRDGSKRRRMVVTLYPNSTIAIRPEQTRREELIPLETVWWYALKARVTAEREAKRKNRKK